MKPVYPVNLIAILLLSGCSPLQQAPLVYSSKVSIGVDVSGTSTETPGAGISIGYKQVDAAYVPVAVAKKCEPSNDSKCAGDTFKLIPLNGNNKQEDGTTPTEAELSSATAAVEQASEELRKKQDMIAVLNARHESTKKLADTTDSLTKKVNDLKNLDPNQELDKTGVDLISANNAKTQLVKDVEALEAAKLDRDVAAAAVQRASDAYQNKLAASKGRNQNAKHDAYSVFGTFDANAGTSVGIKQELAAGLKLGKVFSTGVASQNLTEGLKLYYSAMSPSACLDKIVRLVEYFPVAERQAMAKKLIPTCADTTP